MVRVGSAGLDWIYTGGMIELRPIVESDADQLVPLVYRSAITDTLIWDGPESIEAYREALRLREQRTRAGEELTYLIVNEEAVAVGAIGLHPDLANRSATIGLWLGLPFHGHGYGTKAVAQMLTFGFERMKLERLAAGHLRGEPCEPKDL